jgi:DNA-binding IscR family transcriptional regulator
MSNVDVSSEADLWLSISELAASRGITKGPLSRRVTRLEEQRLLTPRHGPRGSKLISVAEFDRVTNATTDIVRATNGGAAAAPMGEDRDGDSAKGGLVYSQEQARNASYSAQLKFLELEERRKNLVKMDDVLKACATLAERAVHEIEALPKNYADAIAEAVGAEGVPGARRVLRSIAFDLRTQLAAAFRELPLEVAAGVRESATAN